MTKVLDTQTNNCGKITYNSIPLQHICVHTHREYLGDTVGSVPNHHNKAGMTINKSNEFSDFLVHMKSYVYTIL